MNERIFPILALSAILIFSLPPTIVLWREFVNDKPSRLFLLLPQITLLFAIAFLSLAPSSDKLKDKAGKYQCES